MNKICKQLMQKLSAMGLDGMLITDDVSRRYVTDMPDSAGCVLVCGEHAAILTDFRYIEAAKAFGDTFEVHQVDRSVGYPEKVQSLCDAWGAKHIGFENDRMTVADFENWKGKTSLSFEPAGFVISDLRVCKSEAEIASLTAAQRVAEKAWEAMIPKIQRGRSEIELRGDLVGLCYSFGAENMSFDTIVASGENSAKPHAVPGERRVKDGDFVTFDFGVKVNGYCSDMTRTVCVGQPTDEMRKIYDIVLRAQLAAEEGLRAGITYKEFDGIARSLIDGEGYGKAFGHSLSHGIGLEIHEGAFLSDGAMKLPVGAIVSVEPGIYLEGRFGVRIEDMACVTENGCRILTDCDKKLLIL